MICLSSLVSFSMETFSSALKSGFMDLHSTIWDSTDPMPFAEGPLSEKEKEVKKFSVIYFWLVYACVASATQI